MALMYFFDERVGDGKSEMTRLRTKRLIGKLLY